MTDITSTPDKRNGNPIIRVRGLHKYFGPLHVIRGVDLDVMPGEVVVVIGPSGGGKSTFLRCLNFLEQPSAGTIEVDGVEIKARESAREHRQHIREIRQKAGMGDQPQDLEPPVIKAKQGADADIVAARLPRSA